MMLVPASAVAKAAKKVEDRLPAAAEAASLEAIATADHPAAIQITAGLERPSRLSLVLAPTKIDPAATVYINVYLRPMNGAGAADGSASVADERGTLAGTVAFVQAEAIGAKESFLINVPKDMRFSQGMATVTIALDGNGSSLGDSAIALIRARLLK
ncbi:hypothetical protein LQ948_11885 [Jiella sp. MQZ9-1]|uniref:Uncharacterized protein n=1 Tax=Jiella flava TaxID=2816857 RepID=A0A939JUM4_9HYPH|nr:hypothetical protein [Jiella flava]MBO0663335.1 hypothetical protein [Jiella flava]MCD2471911.1 hypothetical protein [Jiella flava]